jgi:enamine deaminase RidA (YjgF/YER057c/UK114 family)
MKRENFFDGTEVAPGYCRVVRAGSMVFVAGTGSTDETGRVVGDDVYAQTREIYRKMETALARAGASLQDVVKVVAYCTDIKNGSGFIKAHAEVFGAINPVATLVAVSGLVKPEFQIEIEAEALVGAEA